MNHSSPIPIHCPFLIKIMFILIFSILSLFFHENIVNNISFCTTSPSTWIRLLPLHPQLQSASLAGRLAFATRFVGG